MSVPYFPMYPADFEADTSHLTLEEDGAYNRLLRIMWMTPGCSLPDDDRWVMRRMRVDRDTYDRVVGPLIEEFLTRSKGRIFSKRLLGEFEKACEAHKRRKDAGSKGGRAKSRNVKENDPSKAVALPKQPEPEPEPYINDDDDSARDDGAIIFAAGIDREKTPSTYWNGPGVTQDIDRWFSAGLSQKEIVAVIGPIMTAKRDPPSRMAYFDKPMREFLGRKNAPTLTPIQGGRPDGKRNRGAERAAAFIAGAAGQA